MDRTGVDCLLSGFIEIFLMMFQTKIIKPDVGDRTNNTRETARAGLSTTKCDLKRIPDLETAIREGIDSGEAGTLSTNWKNSPRHIAAGMKFVIFAKDKNSLIYDNSTHRGQYA